MAKKFAMVHTVVGIAELLEKGANTLAPEARYFTLKLLTVQKSGSFGDEDFYYKAIEKLNATAENA